MLSIEEQINRGIIVCPKTRQPLLVDAARGGLTTPDGKQAYPFQNGRVPVFFADPASMAEYLASNPAMESMYDQAALQKKPKFFDRIKGLFSSDYRTEASKQAFLHLFKNQPSDAVILSIGGGPTRPHPELVNLNIGAFANVDVIGDAHCLPYADGSVHAIYCEAVLEHLTDPVQAVKEMHRVLKLGGSAFVVTPFMQAYHGYPHHYQNFTVTGHTRLFIEENFEILEHGVCVGPTHALVTIGKVYISTYMPKYIRRILRPLWSLVGHCLMPLDKFIGKKDHAYILASTVYVLARKHNN